ncbi:hypothetical protein DF185_03065 [Marinifilum breve]|uniref:Uncharacterized protein n=1 Tax=Marinifilum breve TaxID=2184082 RepID=A0A2V4A300_9BACT|nr:hypothetical protein [Marinifilum breve]PXY03086.1 hypothetical protein DF185_03065 [Marinifilum breve]
MKASTLKSGITYREILIFLISSLAIVLFLFYIDEGYYSFDWIKEPLALVVLLIYFLPAFLCQLFIHTILLKINIPTGRTVLSVIIGIILGIGLVVSVFYLL